MSLELVLSPAGQLLVEPAKDTEPRLSPATIHRLRDAFGKSGANGLELLASAAIQEPLPPVLAFWREFARRYFTCVCQRPAPGIQGPHHPPSLRRARRC